MLRQILFKTLSFSAIAALGLSLLVFNPSSPSGFSEAYAACDENGYTTCMDSCLPACQAWYHAQGYWGITYEECWNECHYTMCGVWYDCL